MQKEVAKIIKKLSLKYGIKEDIIKEIVESQYKCIREEFSKIEYGKPKTFKNARLRHLGLLVARENKILAIEKNKKIKNGERENG